MALFHNGTELITAENAEVRGGFEVWGTLKIALA